MATKEKVLNYTEAQETRMRTEYVANPTRETVDALAQAFGKTSRSIIAKLSRMGVYKAKEYVTKAGEKPVKKDEHADAIGAVLRLTEPEIESLTKANKSALKKIFDALAMSTPIGDEDDKGEDKAE